jgi:hypothetical protein
MTLGISMECHYAERSNGYAECHYAKCPLRRASLLNPLCRVFLGRMSRLATRACFVVVVN